MAEPLDAAQAQDPGVAQWISTAEQVCALQAATFRTLAQLSQVTAPTVQGPAVATAAGQAQLAPGTQDTARPSVEQVQGPGLDHVAAAGATAAWAPMSRGGSPAVGTPAVVARGLRPPWHRPSKQRQSQQHPTGVEATEAEQQRGRNSHPY